MCFSVNQVTIYRVVKKSSYGPSVFRGIRSAESIGQLGFDLGIGHINQNRGFSRTLVF